MIYMKPIVEITDKAKNEIRRIFVEQKEKEGPKELGIRLGVIGGGCSGLSYRLDFSEPKEKDNVFDYGDFRVFIDLKSSIYLKGVRLDFKDGLNGKGFVFENPNAKNTCGCGESFAV